MKIIAWDQATKISAYSVFDDDTLTDYGLIDLHKEKDTEERVKHMGQQICAKIDEIKPNMVIIEDVQDQGSPQTMKLLARIQGIAIGYAYANGMSIHILAPSSWRKVLGYQQGPKVKREELKAQSVNRVKESYKLELSEDICEAICIGDAARKVFCEQDNFEI